MKSFDKAEKLVRKISKKQPDNLSYGADLGFVYQSQGQDEKAQQQYERTIKMLRPDQGLILSLANAFIIRQDWDHALATYLEGKRLVKEEYGFHFELADVYYQKGDFTGMINEYLDAVAENPMVQQQVLNILQSRVGYDPENNKGDLLRTSLLRRIQKNPDQPIFSEMLIWLFVQQKDFDSAFLQAKALDKRMKEDGSRVLSLGNLAASNFNYDAAIKCYQYVVDKGTMNSNYIPARMELLNTYNKKITEENNYTSADLLKLEKDYETTLAELGRTARTASLVRGSSSSCFYLDRAIQPWLTLNKLLISMGSAGKHKQSVNWNWVIYFYFRGMSGTRTYCMLRLTKILSTILSDKMRNSVVHDWTIFVEILCGHKLNWMSLNPQRHS
jgi:tetratricopeptide (TPR) repeat protein